MRKMAAPGVWLLAIRAKTGADVFTMRLCDELKANGVRAEIAWLPHRAEYLPWTVAVPRPPSWANVAHVNSWLPLRFWPKGLPIVVTVHHLVHDPAFRKCRSAMQAAYHELIIRGREFRAIQEADAVTTVSNYVRETVLRFSDQTEVALIPNWVDCEKFRPCLQRVSNHGGPFRLFMAGSRSKRKGTDLLSQFIAALGVGFDIRYAGARPFGSKPIIGVTELGRISDDELISEYNACDAVISLSRYEGFGYTALEAMACGKPFLGFDTSALPEVVAKQCGILVPVDDTSALANAARQLRALPELGLRMGRCGRDRATAEFGQGKVDAYVAKYVELIAGDGSVQE